MRISRPVHKGELACFAGVFSLLHMYSTAVDNRLPRRRAVAFSTAFDQTGDVDNGLLQGSGYTRPRPARVGPIPSFEP